MKSNIKLIEKKMKVLIELGSLDNIKEMVKNIDIHYSNDYYLYVAAFYNQVEIQKYFIEIGLDPEKTKGRLAVAHPETLQLLYQYKEEKKIREYAEKLDMILPKKNINGKKVKI